MDAGAKTVDMEDLLSGDKTSGAKPAVVHRKRAKGISVVTSRIETESLDVDIAAPASKSATLAPSTLSTDDTRNLDSNEEPSVVEIDADGDDSAVVNPSTPRADNGGDEKRDAAAGADPSTLRMGTEEWLRARKAKWRELRDERKRRRGEVSGIASRRTGVSAVGVAPSASSGMGAFYSQQTATLHATPWQLLTIQEGTTPGELHAWVILSSRTGLTMHSIPIIVPRTVYVAMSTPHDHPGWVRVQRRLPRDARAAYLYEVSLSEEDFRASHGALFRRSPQPRCPFCVSACDLHMPCAPRRRPFDLTHIAHLLIHFIED